MGAASALLLVGGLGAAAPATAKVVPVDGDRWAGSPVTYLTRHCLSTTAEPSRPAEAYIARTGKATPLGLYSIGWRDGETGFGSGVLAHIDNPTDLKRYRVDISAPGDRTTGIAWAVFHAEGDAGRWEGTISVGGHGDKAWKQFSVADTKLAWKHYDETGEPDGGGGDYTVAELARLRGGDGDGAELGFLFGCNHADFRMDDLEVVTDQQNIRIDLGGYRTRTDLTYRDKRPGRITVEIGQSVPLEGWVMEKAGDTRFADKVRFEGRKHGTRSYRLIDSDGAGTSSKAAIKFTPKVSTQVRAAYAGGNKREPSRSDVLKVLVRGKVGSRIADSTVQRGQTFTVNGKILPGRKTRFQLQRYAGGKWVTVKKASTSSTGAFKISQGAATAGTSYWRIRSLTGGGILSDVGPNMKLVVSHPPSQPDPPDPDPDPDPDPEEPPPPPEG